MSGDWVGTYKQSTNGQAGPESYFKVTVKEGASGTYTAHFEYYNLDAKRALQQIGASDATTTITSPTSATSKIVGTGEVMVDCKAKRQQHDITENLTWNCGTMTGRGSGSLKVSGMPLGLGKLGKVRDDQSTWQICGDTLTVHQAMSVVFRALFISKSFRVTVDYTATRGTDVSKVIKQGNM